MTILVSLFSRTRPAAARAVLHEDGATIEDVAAEIAVVPDRERSCSAAWTGTRWPLSGSIWTPCAPGSGRLPGRKPSRRSSAGSLARPG